MLGSAGIDCRIENEPVYCERDRRRPRVGGARGDDERDRDSRAKSCRIALSHKDREVYAEITDDGRGEPDEEDTGSGLWGWLNASHASADSERVRRRKAVFDCASS